MRRLPALCNGCSLTVRSRPEKAGHRFAFSRLSPLSLFPGRFTPMRPRYCCFYLRHELQIGWLANPGGKRVIIVQADGTTIRKRPGDLLWQWEGAPLPSSPKDGDVGESAALEQLREHLEPPPGLAGALEAALDALSQRLAGEEPMHFEDLPFEDLTPDALPAPFRAEGDSAGEQSSQWNRAHLFMGLLRDSRRFRFARHAFSARSPEDMAAWAARRAEEAEREHWAVKAAAFRECLEAGKPLSGDAASGDSNSSDPNYSDSNSSDPDIPEFLARVRSLLALEKRSPFWGLLASPLGLNQLHGEDLALRLKSWLTAADAWPDWPAIWLEWGNVPTVFPTDLEAAAQPLASAPARKGGRDFTSLETYSIDSAETRDIDDAVSILEASDRGLTVAVHIAELDPVLEPGHPLFDEAARRMATAYTLSGTFPMFPEALSQERFSLLAGEPRETLTFILRISEGRSELVEVVRSRVRLTANLDYTGTQRLLDEHPDTWGRLALACAELAEARARRGAVLMVRQGWKLDISDPHHIALKPFSRSGAVHQVVEELAIAYNAAAGDYCSRNGLPAIYRVQPVKPSRAGDPAGMGAMEEGEVRLPTPPARFAVKPNRHTGLGCERYIQATSPIRRFADLVMQRQIAGHACQGRVSFPDSASLEAWALAAESRQGLIDDTAKRIEEDWKRRYLIQQQRLQPEGVVLEGVVRRTDGDGSGGEGGSSGRVWLEDLRLLVLCEVPGSVGIDQRVTLRLDSVDRDRRQVRGTLIA